MTHPLTPHMLLRGYASGIFPMAEGRDDPEVFWVNPKQRGILPLDGFHISRSLRKQITRQPFRITINTAFNEVVAGCAARDETWINAPIAALYRQLHAAGFAHALEVWEDETLVGGVYGVTLGTAFFGESMFSLRANASKIALAYMIHRLRVGGFTLFDTQFVTPHLLSLGAVEIPRAEYRKKLEKALQHEADFLRAPAMPPVHEIMHRSTQIS